MSKLFLLKLFLSFVLFNCVLSQQQHHQQQQLLQKQREKEFSRDNDIRSYPHNYKGQDFDQHKKGGFGRNSNYQNDHPNSYLMNSYERELRKRSSGGYGSSTTSGNYKSSDSTTSGGYGGSTSHFSSVSSTYSSSSTISGSGSSSSSSSTSSSTSTIWMDSSFTFDHNDNKNNNDNNHHQKNKDLTTPERDISNLMVILIIIGTAYFAQLLDAIFLQICENHQKQKQKKQQQQTIIV